MSNRQKNKGGKPSFARPVFPGQPPSKYRKQFGVTLRTLTVEYDGFGHRVQFHPLLDVNGKIESEKKLEPVTENEFLRRLRVYNEPSEADKAISFYKRVQMRTTYELSGDERKDLTSAGVEAVISCLTADQVRLVKMSQKQYLKSVSNKKNETGKAARKH